MANESPTVTLSKLAINARRLYYNFMALSQGSLYLRFHQKAKCCKVYGSRHKTLGYRAAARYEAERTKAALLGSIGGLIFIFSDLMIRVAYRVICLIGFTDFTLQS